MIGVTIGSVTPTWTTDIDRHLLALEKFARDSLTSFYERNHMYICILYYDCKGFWGRPQDEFPDLDEITAFSVMIKEKTGVLA
jgi:hypothetical protein